MCAGIVRTALADRVGWALVVGAFAVLVPLYVGLALVEPVWSEEALLLAGTIPLFVVPAALGLANGLRGGTIVTALLGGTMPAVAALLVNFGETLLGTGTVEATLFGSTLVFGTVGVGAALCGFGCVRLGRFALAHVRAR